MHNASLGKVLTTIKSVEFTIFQNEMNVMFDI